MNPLTVKEQLLSLEGKIGFVYQSLSTGEHIEYGEDIAMNAASLIKLPIMAAAFQAAENGTLDFSREITVHAADKMPSCGALTYMHDGIRVTVHDLLVLMIILSDNTATNLMIDLLGFPAINDEIASLGLTETLLRRKLFDAAQSARGIQNTTSARDMAKLLRMIELETLVSPAASRQMKQILLNQRLNGKIPFFLHSLDIDVAHKTGEDDGITHDVGIIYTDSPHIFCFLSSETNVPMTERCLQDLARMVSKESAPLNP